MRQTLLVTGGCRSGKSRFALEFAASLGLEKKVFVATCVPGDEEMRARVRRHQAARGAGWQTVEAPVALPEAVVSAALTGGIVLIDCLTMWVSNLMTAGLSDEEIDARSNELVDAIRTAGCSVVLVSNEVGTGIVPANDVARRFRDVAGLVNQKVAAAVDNVVLMVAGIPVAIKGDCGKAMSIARE